MSPGDSFTIDVNSMGFKEIVYLAREVRQGTHRLLFLLLCCYFMLVHAIGCVCLVVIVARLSHSD